MFKVSTWTNLGFWIGSAGVRFRGGFFISASSDRFWILSGFRRLVSHQILTWWICWWLSHNSQEMLEVMLELNVRLASVCGSVCFTPFFSPIITLLVLFRTYFLITSMNNSVWLLDFHLARVEDFHTIQNLLFHGGILSPFYLAIGTSWWISWCVYVFCGI